MYSRLTFWTSLKDELLTWAAVRFHLGLPARQANVLSNVTNGPVPNMRKAQLIKSTVMVKPTPLRLLLPHHAPLQKLR